MEKILENKMKDKGNMFMFAIRYRLHFRSTASQISNPIF